MAMTLFKERIGKIHYELKEFRATEEFQKLTNSQRVRANRKFLASKREGDYLIKVAKSNYGSYCGNDQQYIDYTYDAGGWFCLSSRKEAQWFTSKEAQQFIDKVGKGFYIVKR